MTTADKLQRTLDTKTAIKQALVNKGSSPTDVFSTYPALIENMQTGIEPTTSYIQSGVLGGPFYSSSDVSYGLPKPSYLQSTQDSNVLTIHSTSDFPLLVMVALGVDANGRWQTQSKILESDANLTLSESSVIVMQMDDETIKDPTVSFIAVPLPAVTYSRTQPSNPSDGDLWFSFDDNWMKQYGAGTWNNKKWTILGEVGVGSDGFIYSMRSDYPNRQIAEAMDSIYPNNENPWRHYDGVSFVTGGEYTAQRTDQWLSNTVIRSAVFSNTAALYAISSSVGAFDAIASNSVVINEIEGNQFVVDRLTETPTVAIGSKSFVKQLFYRPALHQEFWEQSTIRGSVDFNSTGGSPLYSHCIALRAGYAGFTSYAKITARVDVTDYSTLNIMWSHQGDNDIYSSAKVYINGDKIFYRNKQWTADTNTMNVSSYSGVVEITIASEDRYDVYEHRSDLYISDYWLS